MSARVCSHMPQRRLAPRVLAVALALSAPWAVTAQTSPSWTVTDLGTLFGQPLAGRAVNDRGQVTGAVILGTAGMRAFVWQDGAVVDLGTPGGTLSSGFGINSDGAVAGWGTNAANVVRAFVFDGVGLNALGTLGGSESRAFAVNDALQVTGEASVAGDIYTRAFRWQEGQMVDLGHLGGQWSSGTAINGAGWVTGFSSTAAGEEHAFIHDGDVMRDLGTLGGTISRGLAINDRGQVAGSSELASGDFRAFVWSDGRMSSLGTLGGASSAAFAINEAGWTAGTATRANGEARAFLHSRGRMHDLSEVPGVPGTGWVLRRALSLNNVGQLVVEGELGGESRTALLTLNTTVWDGGPGASWDDAANWSCGIAPNRNTHAVIEAASSRRLLGPTGAVETQRLTLGGLPWVTAAVTTLELAGGEITFVPSGSPGATITSRGELAGRGTLRFTGGGSVTNEGRVVAGDINIVGASLDNLGTLEGAGRIGAEFGVLNFGGRVVPDAGARLRIDASLDNYLGVVEARRAELDIAGSFTNYDRVVVLDGTLRARDLNNFARIDISSGHSDVFGPLLNQSGARVAVSGEGQATFWDRFENFGELRVAAGAVATFFGDFQARGGSTSTGTGTRYFEAGYSVGDSPGIAHDEGDVLFGSAAIVVMELGGETAGAGDGFHDKLVVEGRLGFGGTLVLVSWGSFEAQAGHRFDLFDWGTVEGAFSAIDTRGLVLAAGTWLDTSQLAIDGSVRVLAVPEPAAWALWAAGMAGIWVHGRRRRQAGPLTMPSARTGRRACVDREPTRGYGENQTRLRNAEGHESEGGTT